jgi:hypothetical protein
MPGFTESSITLNFPDDNFFRFANCPGYRSLSGYSFKEMDACWYDESCNELWLFELKDFSFASLDSRTIKEKSWELIKKAVDSLAMLLSLKHHYTYADNNISECLPFEVTAHTQLVFVSIIQCDTMQISDIQLINTDFRNKFKPYAELFGITRYSVIAHSRAMSIVPNNIVR